MSVKATYEGVIRFPWSLAMISLPCTRRKSNLSQIDHNNGPELLGRFFAPSRTDQGDGNENCNAKAMTGLSEKTCRRDPSVARLSRRKFRFHACSTAEGLRRGLS